MNIINKLFCKHDYIFKEQKLIDCGMRKMIIRKCTKCGKEVITFI